jgi:hypothetical protein
VSSPEPRPRLEGLERMFRASAKAVFTIGLSAGQHWELLAFPDLRDSLSHENWKVLAALLFFVALVGDMSGSLVQRTQHSVHTHHCQDLSSL